MAADDGDFILMPLRTWMENVERAKPTIFGEQSGISHGDNSKKELIIRKTTIAYGIVELLKRSNKLDDEEIMIDNFAVSLSKKVRSSRPWDDIKGVSMISSGMSITIEEPSYLSGLLEGEDDYNGQIVGRCLEVELTSAPNTNNNFMTPTAADAALNKARDDYLEGMNVLITAVAEDSNRCHLLARLLYVLFSQEPFPDDALVADAAASTSEPAQKRAKSHDNISSRKHLMLSRAKGDFDRAEAPFQIPCIVRMQNLGIPASLCLMTQNLLEGALRGTGGQLDDAYESLGLVGEDLHLLLLDPDRFLFDNENQNIDNMELLYRRGKLYGRDKEETLITDAFCRVSRGKSEAFFIGGFSGSGKSMLVNSLRDSVNCVGGYVIKHKFDAMSQEKPLSGVISAFNQICHMIKDREKPVIAKRLLNEFGVELSLLMRLLPNVSVLFPGFISPAVDVEAGARMNTRSVCFTLLRFVRVVSSPRHPIMLFLDDLQWADSTALDVIHAILSDTMGSCMFFVGTYRDNEVQVDHYLFDLMEKLKISNVQVTKISLTGLDPEDLNTMISDALCLYPRICKSLSGIVFQKTKGNPFFVLEFMKSLKDRGLLQYNFHQKRWVWNEGITRAEDITYNVLHLLSSKMNRLSHNAQTLLKVMACFGTSTNESVIGYLSESAQYCGFRAWLETAISDGFIEKEAEGNFKFVHDKVREAAYNLIPDSDKKQFHYDLGKVLYSVCEGKDVGVAIFFIASQINHGREWILKDRDLSIAIVELNMNAGKKAIDGCDHKTAHSYLRAASSFLHEGHWESHYDLSLRFSFLMASAANSSCQYDEAELILRRISEKARCLEDKLPCYLLLNRILLAQGNPRGAYDVCAFILSQLGETIPTSVTPEAAKALIAETQAMYEEVYGDEWLKRRIEDENICTVAKFYNACMESCYLSKSRQITIYHVCKAMQLGLQNGICQYTPLALIYFAACVFKDDNAASIYRIAKNAITLLEKFDVPDHIPIGFFNFYGWVAWRYEPFQVCADKTRRAFEIALSSGDVDTAFYCSFHLTRYSIFYGENLRSLLKEVDYYLHLLGTYKSEVARNFLLTFRETVSLLIDNGQATSIRAKAYYGDLDDPGNKMREVFFFHKAIQCYWLGQAERCRYYSEKCMPILGPLEQFNTYMSKFYHGLNSLDLLKKKSTAKSKEGIRLAFAAIKPAAANSDWNFTNKLHLLEAEHQSFHQNRQSQTIVLYDASIASAKRSGFIHEQGLACEKAGFYCKRMKNNGKALEYFNQARECYEGWGSSVKVCFIEKELDGLKGNNFL